MDNNTGAASFSQPHFNGAPVKQSSSRSSLSLMRVLLIILVVAGFGLGSTLGALWWGHYSLAAKCKTDLTSYNQQQKQLENWLDSHSSISEITRDQVLTDDVDTVDAYQSLYAQAKDILSDKVDSNQCDSSHSTADLKKSDNGLTDQISKVNDILGRLPSLATDVKSANEAKQLSDAKAALQSTLYSAQNLSGNSALSDSTRTQLLKSVAVAKSVLNSDDLANVTSVRRQMDDIISQINEKLSSQNAELAQIEAKISSIKSEPDANGDYTGSAINILNSAGISEVWGLDNMRGACAVTPEQAASWIAAFCSATPQKVYINSTLGTDTTHDIYFADAMRHELGHYMIYRRCGSVSPASIGSSANAESTASSYAVLYLGANANTLNRAGDERYHMNQASDDAAARIHAGQCQ